MKFTLKLTILAILLSVCLLVPTPLVSGADITVTAASVAKGTGATTSDGIAGATITAGQAVYLDSTTNTIKLADANASSAASTAVGIALHGAASGQPIKYQTGGQITIGATVAVGTIYVVSGTAGGIAPSTDLASGWYTNILGVATTTGIITMGIQNSGVAVP